MCWAFCSRVSIKLQPGTVHGVSLLSGLPFVSSILLRIFNSIKSNWERVGDVPFRKETYTAQAPQSFILKDILDAHEQIRKRPEGYENMVDACTILRTLGREVHMVRGNRGNLKITTPEDVFVYRALLEYREHEETFGLGAESI